MEKPRCHWAESTDSEALLNVHDKEWGVPTRDDQTLWQYFLLAGFNAGIPLATIIEKRPHFREAFAGFDPFLIADFDEDRIQQLMENEGIVRNEQKIRAAVRNARNYTYSFHGEGEFSDYIWAVTNNRQIPYHYRDTRHTPPETAFSRKMERKMRADGFTYCAATICYRFMQLAGLVLDHQTTCFRYEQILSGN